MKPKGKLLIIYGNKYRNGNRVSVKMTIRIFYVMMKNLLLHSIVCGNLLIAELLTVNNLQYFK